jgi:hypothetical protein
MGLRERVLWARIEGELRKALHVELRLKMEKDLRQGKKRELTA